MAKHIDKTNSLSESMNYTLQKCMECYEQKTTCSGFATYYEDLDCFTAGLQPSDLTVVAGRPSVGKTNFALNLGLRVATRSNVPSLFFSISHSLEQIMMRIFSIEAKIHFHNLKMGYLGDEDWIKLYNVNNELSHVPFFINDTPRLTVEKIVKIVHEYAEKEKLGLIIIDYLQLLCPATPRLPRDQEIADMTRELKILARETETHIILLSQLNRRCEDRQDKRPYLFDLRDSGAIEDDADNIMFIYRDALYNNSDDNPLKNKAEIIMAKQRSGSVGNFDLFFHSDYGLFENMNTVSDTDRK
ncbi:DnaB-like helicase C-terminal domain-containing protein [Pseudodesulfovibrio tunisiensis]|uniref:DnaB-like helicase C-terminal domain-containing protein n=1 Tax=Pseudodesulfovibrio tunisiensis TaxID=463192 RepID=UPI001FB4E4CF|nr:DnaB-like helicase C-terminal domain-containing protein [Pseudodesulfovibrio tunisiensis]